MRRPVALPVLALALCVALLLGFTVSFALAHDEAPPVVVAQPEAQTTPDCPVSPNKDDSAVQELEIRDPVQPLASLQSLQPR